MNKKKSILLVVDNEKWAFYNIATNFQKYLKDDFEVDIVAMERLNGNIANLFLFAQKYDLIHFFWRGLLLDLNIDFTKTYIYNLGLSVEEFIDKYIKHKNITTAVYDHKLLDTKDINEICKYIKSYYTSSTLLKNIYQKLDLNMYPDMVITDGIDLKILKIELLI